jgi:hypothetical protein
MRDAYDFDLRIENPSMVSGIGAMIEPAQARQIETRLEQYTTNCRANVLRDALNSVGVSNVVIAGLSTDRDITELFVGIRERANIVGGIRCNGKGIVSETLIQMQADNSYGKVTFFNVSRQEHARQVAITEIGVDGFQRAVTDVIEILQSGGIES